MQHHFRSERFLFIMYMFRVLDYNPAVVQQSFPLLYPSPNNILSFFCHQSNITQLFLVRSIHLDLVTKLLRKFDLQILCVCLQWNIFNNKQKRLLLILNEILWGLQVQTSFNACERQFIFIAHIHKIVCNYTINPWELFSQWMTKNSLQLKPQNTCHH